MLQRIYNGLFEVQYTLSDFCIEPQQQSINYLRTLPLHASQKELTSTEEYADFEYNLRPTFDFKQELLAQGDEVEVLELAEFRQEMKDIVQWILKRYS